MVVYGEQGAPFQSAPTGSSLAFRGTQVATNQSGLDELSLSVRSIRTETQQAIQQHHPNGQLLLVTGPPGSGKTRLVQDIFPSCCTGKFDALRRSDPYHVFVSAMTEWAHGNTHQKIRMCRKEECRVLEQLIPALKGCWVEEVDKQTQEECSFRESGRDGAWSHHQHHRNGGTSQRLGCLIRKLLYTMATTEGEHGVMVLLFDDLQYADPCSLDLIGNVMVDLQNLGTSSKLMIVSSCESSAPPVVAQFLQNQRQFDRIKEIECPNIDQTQIEEFLKSVMPGCYSEQVTELAEVIKMETNGNLMQMVELTQWLDEARLIDFQKGSQPTWNINKIRNALQDTPMHNILQRKLLQQSLDVLDVLRVAACIGSQINESLIGYVLGDTVQRPIRNILEQAAGEGFLVQKRGSYGFAHDGIQRAVYDCIPEGERDVFHLSIGRRLWNKLDAAELDQNIFVLLSQVSVGKKLVDRKDERQGLADLCLFAGRKAAKWSVFRVAAIYMHLGIEFLSGEGWDDKYDLALSLHNGAAEMCVCSGDLESMEILTDEVKQHSRRPRDFLQIETTRLYAMGISGRQEEAIDLGLEIMESLGETFPRRLGHVQLVLEAVSVKFLLRNWLLGREGNESILKLPHMTDPDKLICLSTINLLVLHAMVFKPKLFPFLSLRAVKLTLRYGLTLMAPQAFGAFAATLGSLGQFDCALRLGELALYLMDHFGHDESLPRVYASYYGCVWSSRHPRREALEPHIHAYRVGMQTGDFEYAFLNANMYVQRNRQRSLLSFFDLFRYCWAATHAGVPLPEISATWKESRTEMKRLGQQAILDMAEPCVVVTDLLMGHEEPSFEDLFSRRPATAQAFLRSSQLYAYYVLNNRDGMRSIIKSCLNVGNLILLVDDAVKHSWLCSMAMLYLANTRREKRRALRNSRRTIGLLQRRCRDCPQNYLGHLNFLQAEVAWASGRRCEAEVQFLQTIGLAAMNRNLFLEAKARERTGWFHHAHGKYYEALEYMRSSRSCFVVWGAQGKANMLNADIELFEQLCRGKVNRAVSPL